LNEFVSNLVYVYEMNRRAPDLIKLFVSREIRSKGFLPLQFFSSSSLVTPSTVFFFFFFFFFLSQRSKGFWRNPLSSAGTMLVPGHLTPIPKSLGRSTSLTLWHPSCTSSPTPRSSKRSRSSSKIRRGKWVEEAAQPSWSGKPTPVSSKNPWRWTPRNSTRRKARRSTSWR